MIPNYNETLGYPYGVMAENRTESGMELGERVRRDGRCVTYEAAMEDLRRDIANWFDPSAEIGSADDADSHYRAFCRAHYLTVQDLPADLWDATTGWDLPELQELLVDQANNLWEFDEMEYLLETPEEKYLISFLGGAPLIWVCHSRYITLCQQCSPCVSGAGDLDSASASGSFALCPPPEEADYHEMGFVEVWRIDEDEKGQSDLAQVWPR